MSTVLSQFLLHKNDNKNVGMINIFLKQIYNFFLNKNNT